MNPDLVKGPWTKEEDQKVTSGYTVGLHSPCKSRDFEPALGFGRGSSRRLGVSSAGHLATLVVRHRWREGDRAEAGAGQLAS